MTAGATILGIGYLLPLFYLLWSCKYGLAAGPNPWRAKGFEWQIPSPLHIAPGQIALELAQSCKFVINQKLADADPACARLFKAIVTPRMSFPSASISLTRWLQNRP